MSADKIEITIIYDNTARDTSLIPDWGFACLVKAFGKTILFDTGAKSNILFNNMKILNINPMSVDEIFISHDHWDHTGGLAKFLSTKNVPVYAPAGFETGTLNTKIITYKDLEKIHENIWTTGTLHHIEHSLLLTQKNRVTVIAGCSHPGVEEIFTAGQHLGKISTLVGGLHGFSKFDLIKDIEQICPTHCTQYIDTIKAIYPDKYINGGAGKVLLL